MPYNVGKKGSYGCSGYPAVKTDTGEVMGCHDTEAEAMDQIQAIAISESKKVADPDTEYNNSVDFGNAKVSTSSYVVTYKNDCCPDEEISKEAPCWEGYTQRGMKPGKGGRMVPNCVPVAKIDAPIVEGDFVVAMTTEGQITGQVEHIMTEGGTYGQPGNPYSVESTPENPAVAIRILEEEEDGKYCYTPYSIGTLMSSIRRIPMPEIDLEDYEDLEMMNKAEGYRAPAGAASAARRAIKFKEDGKANGAGTAVGWTRAGQLARGETLSLSTVKRMYSYFSRHEVDKKGKDWGNTSNPSNGYIMWLAWGGDAGFSWSRGIVNREMDKAIFADFGKDYTRVDKLTQIFND